MCEVGDIILVSNYKSDGCNIGTHSFVVLSTSNGKINGLDYDLICNVMSSFKSDKQRKRKMSYPGNFPVSHNDTEVKNGNCRDGYIKAEQFYYFDRDKIDYTVIGSMHAEAFNKLIEFIESLYYIKEIVDNILP